MDNNLLKIFYNSRRAFWNYPDKLFFNKNSIFVSFLNFYKESIPLSHIITSILIILLLFTQISTSIYAYLSIEQNLLIEGIVTGSDEKGKPLPLTRINPLISTNVQLEKDISEIIYDSLIEVDAKGDPNPGLADFFIIEKGKRYQFKLKPDLYWSDGNKITAEDVFQTFQLIQSLESNPQFSNIYSRAASKLEVIKSSVDPDAFEFRVTGDNVIPGFFEAISFKILPSHLIEDLNAYNIGTPDPYLNRNPVGSGPYKLNRVTSEYIELIENPYYYAIKPQIKKIRFRLYPTQANAINALLTGQIHSLAGISIEDIKSINDANNLEIYKTDVLYNQFFGLFFNLAESGPPILKNEKFRQAVSSAINKEELIDAMLNYAEEATGPIPKTSFAYSKQTGFNYDINKANSLLDELGYIRAEDGTRLKENVRLTLSMTFVDSTDRTILAEIIKDQLAKVGIEILLNPVSLQEAVDEHIIPRSFEILFYGVQTLIDPDRYELFHSSQIAHPGLNISSYISETKRTQVVDGKTEKVPAVDDDLNDARRIIEEKAREKRYEDFQKIIAQEIPVIFLFHPEDVYVINKRVTGIDLSGISFIEQRFNNISDWVIGVDK